MAGPASAQSDPRQWLPAGSTIETTLATRPARWIIPEMKGGHMGYMARLGELAFRSPLTLGRDAARKGISCDACHPNGAANADFFIPGNSDKPGNVDLTHAFFSHREDDGQPNPVNIPSLRGARWTAPYGRDGRFPTLDGFTRNVIVREFGAPEPPAWIVDALVAYQMDLAFAPPSVENAYLPDGCDDCHGTGGVGAVGRHDIGTGGIFDPPPLRNVMESGPWLHDGSADTLPQLLQRHGLPRDDGRRNILRYLARVGGVATRYQPETLDGDLDRLLGFFAVLNQPLLDEAGDRADIIADMVAMEIGHVFGRFQEDATLARPLVQGWALALKAVQRSARAAEFPKARIELEALGRRIGNERQLVARDIGRSLYPVILATDGP
ncbi:MAG: hypothetical protein VYB54_09135 [Pseudomonadota bacterium]|nr:hypothetical protein [Pseudomonadota bacterium]